MSAPVPDVTVIVAVYNTMPYLAETLTSLVSQTIGLDRLEVIAVDDGSTDGSGAELDRWQSRHPATIKVIHQANSGGPAAPSNRALDQATGRYVFFIGADDHLGPEALERLVRAADELEADVVLGRLVGAGGRFVSQLIFDPGDRDDITLTNSALPFALSNTKLFRRSLLEEHHIRYPEQLRSQSDQPFTIQAVVKARRVAVRSDYKFYFAVRRTDSSNITYGTPLHDLLSDTAVLMDLAADLIPDDAARHRVLHRHFTWEVTKVLNQRFLDSIRAEQSRVQDGIKKLAETYLTDDVRSSLEAHRRLLVSVAQFGTLDDLITVLRHHLKHKKKPVIVEDGRHYLGYPFFRDPERAFPDEWYDATATLAPPVHQATPATVRWGRNAAGQRSLVVEWRSSLTDLNRTDEPRPRVFAGDHVAAQTEIRPDGTVRADFVLHDVIAEDVGRKKRPLRFVRTLGGEFHSLPVTVSGKGKPLARILHRRGLRLWSVAPDTNRDGQLRIVVNRVTPRRLAGAVVSRLRLR
ncbi:glycosyltransferase [Actinoplanes sp. NBRC 103695]|uniref:glycosyltransferase n=1 Tax=Actinoplanes sp. NBRC 103695 TaxID=3032202 RepID=UPI00255583C4|nr:glycosyltransferase [Actinoplanes sp. NBRC 103695]